MLYGRRVIESQRTTASSPHRKFILNKSFQYKYSWYMITAVAGGSLLFLVPAFYFISQNYQLFVSLAFDTRPSLVQHLEREVTWLRAFLTVSFLFIIATSLFFSIRMTKNLLSPLVSMEKHMHQLMLGQWNIPDFKIPEDDDFRELSMTYDYFYRSLKANTEAELKLLEKLTVDPQNREAYATWKQLMETKRALLGIESGFISNENVVELSGSDLRRRAS
ncbi:hypothetical protein D3C87_103310 [compost metagenome]